VEPFPNSRSGKAQPCPKTCPLAGELPPGISLHIRAVLSAGRALTSLAAEKARPLLVICRSRARAEQVSRLLSGRLRAEIPFYHHGLDEAERAYLRVVYMRRVDSALVTTPAAGRELLRNGLRTLIYARPPPTAGELLRDVGRVGLDRRAGEAIMLLPPPRQDAEGRAPGSRGRKAEQPRCIYCPRPGCAEGCARPCGFGSACLRAAAAIPPGWREIVAAVAANDRTLSQRELCLLLAGRGGFATVRKKLYMYTGYAYLCAWQSEDIVEAVSALLRDGVLRVPQRGAWRHHVALVHGEVRWKIHFRNYCESIRTARAV
jgi:hypothetical protein